jgi:uncharacterized protein (DUF1778 family)
MRKVGNAVHASGSTQAEAHAMVRTHTTLDLDRDLLRDAAEALGTTRTTETVHAALRDVVARHRRADLARRDFSELEAALADLRAPREPSRDLPR